MLKAAFSESKRISIAVAYISGDGLEKVKSFIQVGQSIRIVCGIHGCISDLKALNEFNQEVNQSEGHVFIGTELFHPKLYLFQHDDSAMVWIGSANLTRGGLINNEETLIKLKGNSSHILLTEIISYFNNLWETRSIPVDYYLMKHPDYMVKKVDHELTKAQAEIVESYEPLFNLNEQVLTFKKKVKQEIYNNGRVTIPAHFNQTLHSLRYCSSGESRIINLVLPDDYKIKARFYQSENNTTSSYYQFYVLAQHDKARLKKHIELGSILEFRFNLINHSVRVHKL
jgi:HKD family nuclease